jgi:uncharacterized protein YbcI
MSALESTPLAEGHGKLAADITRAAVQVHRSCAGRGPTRAHAFYRGEVLVVVLRDVLTKAERTLAASGRQEAARAIRSVLHKTMRADLVRDVEALTGCRVDAFLADSHMDPEVTILLFVLDRPLRTELAPQCSTGGAPTSIQ